MLPSWKSLKQLICCFEYKICKTAFDKKVKDEQVALMYDFYVLVALLKAILLVTYL